MLLKLCRDDGLYLPERMESTCRDFASSKAPSELICPSGAHVPLSHVFAANCSGYASKELIITQCRVVSLLRKLKMICGGKTRILGPNKFF